MIIYTDFVIEVTVDDVVDTPDPVRVAGVYQLIRSAIETAKLDLSLRQPVHKPRYVQLL